LARRILLADDSVTAQNMGRRILTDAGYEVITVNNGSAALKKIAEQRPDLIVLDVYMPGYGGLEVCQRIKESSDTARIPVLLTVGKLEPFKPDEARRVRADAFIVKPFEATELLTALTKLEDKIVAQPQPQKTGRFAKALAAVEQSETGERFGDRETGWKSRLIIPDPSVKTGTQETEVPETAAPAPAVPQLDRSEPSKPSEPTREFERPIPAGLPADITPEEIAAITAAAAAFSGKPEPSAAAPDTAIPDAAASVAEVIQQAAPASRVEVSQEATSAESVAASAGEAEAPAVTLASTPEAEVKTAPEVPAETTPAAPEAMGRAVASEAPKAEEIPAPSELPAVAAQADSATQPSSEIAAPVAEQSASDAEVMAAIASLAPTNGHAVEYVPSASEAVPKPSEQVPAVASIAAGTMASGPHWIAELVAVTSEESALSLEREMERAQASAAVAEATAPTPAVVSAIESTVPVATAEPEQPTAVAATVNAAESVASAETEAATETIAAAEVVVAAQSVPAPVSAEAAGAEVSSLPAMEPAVTREEAAYAAAAAASSTAGPAHTVEATSPAPALPEPSESTAAATAPQREAELAAAWQNWKQIRESYAGSQPSSQAVETPAPTSEAAPTEEAVTAPQAASAEPVAESAEVEEAASDAPGESTEIVNIVDSMLAELRPKLVAEIARKMGSEKKDRQKDRDKDRKKKK
jgi:CheY-like chemotaxis protein